MRNPSLDELPWAANRSLSASQRWQLFFEKARFSDFPSIRKRGEVSQPDIKPDRWQHVADLGGLWKIARDNHEPFIRFALQAQRRDRSFAALRPSLWNRTPHLPTPGFFN